MSSRMDFMDICTIPEMMGNTLSSDPADWCDELDANILEDWDLFTETQVRAWQYSINKCFSDEDRVTSHWLQSFIYNSSTDKLCPTAEKITQQAPNESMWGECTFIIHSLRHVHHDKIHQAGHAASVGTVT